MKHTNKDLTQKSLATVKNLIGNVQGMSREKFQETLDSMVRFHNYSLFNSILLLFAGASQAAGYKRWKELGRTVKKGEKAIWILAPWFKKVETEGEEKKPKVLKGFFSVPVFDISQTEGKQVEKGLTTFSPVSLKTVKTFGTAKGYIIASKPLDIDLGGYITDHHIYLNSNLSEAENTGTLIHELAHGELGHQAKKNGNTPKKIREEQAEVVTYLVCKVLGIKRKSYFYLRSWELSEDIIKDFKVIHKAFKEILAGLTQNK